jgi:hypothetical protein
MERACGLDVHKESVFACIFDEQGKKGISRQNPVGYSHNMFFSITLYPNLIFRQFSAHEIKHYI